MHLAGERDGSGNLTITWIRRTRIGGEWADGADAPLSEETEAYEIDIMDGADQTADFGSPQASVDVVVYQLSALVGRGRRGISGYNKIGKYYIYLFSYFPILFFVIEYNY
ncbi:MAG: hypothetical protein ABW189_05615 [Rickettsiales bacterium]